MALVLAFHFRRVLAPHPCWISHRLLSSGVLCLRGGVVCGKFGVLHSTILSGHKKSYRATDRWSNMILQLHLGTSR